jgi:hypothetical protein
MLVQAGGRQQLDSLVTEPASPVVPVPNPGTPTSEVKFKTNQTLGECGVVADCDRPSFVRQTSTRKAPPRQTSAIHPNTQQAPVVALRPVTILPSVASVQVSRYKVSVLPPAVAPSPAPPSGAP